MPSTCWSPCLAYFVCVGQVRDLSENKGNKHSRNNAWGCYIAFSWPCTHMNVHDTPLYAHTAPLPVDSTYFIRHYGTFWGGHHFCCFGSVYHVLTHYSSLLQDLFFVTKEVSVGWRKKEPSKTELSGTGAWRMLEHGQTETSSERTGISRESPQVRWDQRGISGFWVEKEDRGQQGWMGKVLTELGSAGCFCRVQRL